MQAEGTSYQSQRIAMENGAADVYDLGSKMLVC
jgi:hypothetical protein